LKKGGKTHRGQCYYHNFLRFSPFFGGKTCVFLENLGYDQNFVSVSVCSVSNKKRHFLKIITSAPDP
jgi:hypothetical protein